MIHMGRPDEGFAGDTPEMQTVPPKGFLLFNQQRLGTELGSTRGNGQPGGTAADDTDVVIKFSHVKLLYFPFSDQS